MEADPLLETLDAVLPAEDREQMAFVPAEIPSSVEDILTALQRQPGIEAVTLGRQVRAWSLGSLPDSRWPNKWQK